MATNLPRISAYISRRLHARLQVKLEDSGLTMTEYVRGLIEADLEGHQDYMLRLMAHRMTLMSIQVGAMAKEKFDDDEYHRLRKMAVTMGRAAFGPLPVRPYDFEEIQEEEERILALHAVLDPLNNVW